MLLDQSGRRRAIIFVAFYMFAGLLYAYLFYPGVMDWDSASIHKMALSENYHTWFPPAFTFIWQLTNSIGNPGAIWVMQTLLLLSGTFLLSYVLLNVERLLWALALGLAVISPPFVYGFHEMTKDTFMDAALVALTGVNAWLLLTDRDKSVTLIGVILSISTLAIISRYNAVFAVVPLISLAFYAVEGKNWKVGITYAFIAIACIVALISVFVKLVLKPEDTAPITATIIFDLAGIANNGGERPFVLAPGADIESMRSCYTPVYSHWYFSEDCGGLFKAVYDTYRAAPLDTAAKWIAAIIRNPLSYARHRVSNLMFLLRISCHTADRSKRSGDWYCNNETGISIRDADQNPIESKVRQHTAALAYDRIGRAFFLAVQPWAATALAMVIWIYSARTLRRKGSDAMLKLAFALTSSCLIYLLSYTVLGNDSLIRYVYWIYIASFLASILLAARWNVKVLWAESLDHQREGLV